VDAGEVGEAVEDAAEGFFFGVIEEDIAAAGAGHDVVEVGGEGGGAEDAFAAAGPGTRGGEEGGFGVDGEEWVGGGRVGGKGVGRCFHGGRIAKVRKKAIENAWQLFPAKKKAAPRKKKEEAAAAE
jgi:hypothetical protein